MKNYKILSISLILIMFNISCKKDFLEKAPTYAALEESVLAESITTVTSALNGASQELFDFGVDGSTGHDNYGQKSWDLCNELMADDCVVNGAGYGWYNRDYQYTEWINPNSGRRSDIFWRRYYRIVSQMNNIIKYIDKVPNSTTDQKDAIKGQAYGLRAYAYFYLANSYQQTYFGNENKPGVPVVTEASITAPGRGKLKDVYVQINKDLDQAMILLEGKVFPDKTSFDIRVAQGFKARTALLMRDWTNASKYAKLAYSSGSTLMTPAQYKEGFSKISNPEWMWGSYIPANLATFYASYFSHMDVKTNGYASLGQQKKIPKDLYDRIPVGDVRKTVFQQAANLTPVNGVYTTVITGYTTPSTSSPLYNQIKFRVPQAGSWAADYLYMRAAEMYLIEAEALANQNNDAGARTALETLVKTRYPAYSVSALSGAALMDEILLQRRIELWGEGMRFMDIKRLKMGLNRLTGSGNHGVPNLDPVVFKLPDAASVGIMRIPQNELETNPNMTPADQNP